MTSGGLEWLLSFSDVKRGVGWNTASRGGLEANLRRTRVLLDLAGAPDRSMKIVLVAGTKGKGSTAAMLASILAASGVRAGLATKPHLQSYRERIRVDGAAIDDATLDVRIAALRPLVNGLTRRLPEAGSPTTFELTSVLAYMHFAAERCEVAVVEVGLGGKFDATNAADPHVSVITAISRDHARELGTKLAGIATQKAGIVRPGRVAVIAPQPADARAAIFSACERAAAVRREVAALSMSAAHGLALRGAHQRANASAAIAAAEALAEHGVGYTKDASARGIASLEWPGRFEIVPGTRVIVLDGAHNDGSAEALARTLRAEFPRRRFHFILGLMAEKDARAVLGPLLPIAGAIEVTQPRSPRALAAGDLATAIARSRGLVKKVVAIRTHADVASAIAAARRDARAEAVVCVTGSLALVGEARDVLGLPVAERLWPRR
ncbi:MAG TPA: Mur ligase family protein [Candidatus Limnocylindrales bacterium]|nr:Mur ligase family protein [Candidatus Limnocylindrales bacterium]